MLFSSLVSLFRVDVEDENPAVTIHVNLNSREKVRYIVESYFPAIDLDLEGRVGKKTATYKLSSFILGHP